MVWNAIWNGLKWLHPKNIAHVVRVVHSHIREHTKGRSPQWRSVRKKWLTQHPVCAIPKCGSRKVQVHHVEPFHEHPEKELDFNNLVTLCEYIGGPEHHRRAGHRGNYQDVNTNLRNDLKEMEQHPERVEEILQRIANSR